MPQTRQGLAAHMAQFETMLDDAFRHYQITDGLPLSIRQAVRATPRHRFMHRFRLDEGPLQDADANPAPLLASIHSDAVMVHVDAVGQSLPSTNSQPSYVLWLLHLLGIEPGHRVLEIGSGLGWLSGIMAHLVGPSGHVTGIEIIPELAAQSRRDLTAAGIHDVTILTRDGTLGDAAGAPFDRVMITAGIWDLPVSLFDQVADGGRVLAPIELRGGNGCIVTVLVRSRERFVAERSTLGAFVPLVGSGQLRDPVERRLDELSAAPDAGALPAVRWSLPLGAHAGGGTGAVADEFEAFLGRTEFGFAAFRNDVRQGGVSWMQSSTFGLHDEDGSIAVCKAGELLGYRGTSAANRLLRAYRAWTRYGLPGSDAFDLEIIRADQAPAHEAHAWIEIRQDTALLWRMKRSVLEPGLPAPEEA